VQRLDFFWTAQECAIRIAAAIVEPDHVVQRGGLAVAKVRRGLSDLPKRLRSPEANGDRLLAEGAITFRVRIVAEVSVDVEVAVGNRRVADEGLIGSASGLGRVRVWRKRGVDVQPNDMKIVVRKQRGVVALDASGLTDKEFEAGLGILAHRVAVAGDVAVEWCVAAHQLAEIGFDGWVEGKYAEAEPVYLRALELRRLLLGEEQDDTVSTMNNLATLYMSEGKYADAEPLLTNVVEIRRRVRGEDEPRTLISMNNLALLYRNQGDYSQAESLFAKVLKARRRLVGQNNPDMLKTMDALAGLYRITERYADAEPLLTEVLEARRGVLGEQHPDTLASLNSMALLYLEQHRYAQAEDLFNRVMEVRRRVLGPDHPDTISVLDSLGRMRLEQLRYAEAEVPLQEAPSLQEKKSPNSWERYDTESMLGASLAGQGKYSDAEALLLSGYRGLLNRESSIPAPNRSAMKQAGGRIVQLYQDWGKPDQAADWRTRLPPQP